MKTIAIDIDGTICTEEKAFERGLAVPFQEAILTINQLHQEGYTIILFTGRGWQEYKQTKKWLNDNGVKHDELIMGKPFYDVFVDDRALKNFKELEQWLIH